jgi:hypothetical protein
MPFPQLSLLLQFALQPSPPFVFPSSHASDISTTPFPHVPGNAIWLYEVLPQHTAPPPRRTPQVASYVAKIDVNMSADVVGGVVCP